MTLDDSPEALAEVVDVLIKARAVSPEFATLLRSGGVDVPDEAVYDTHTTEDEEED